METSVSRMGVRKLGERIATGLIIANTHTEVCIRQRCHTAVSLQFVTRAAFRRQ
jgi:hypothetical protein